MEKLLLLQYSTTPIIWLNIRGLPDTQLACGDNPPLERQSQGFDTGGGGDSKSLAYNNQIQEVTSEPSIGEGQLQKDKEAGLRGNQETSAARRRGADGEWRARREQGLHVSHSPIPMT
ncbi:unnamed protein product [Coregonus sp. 'balchen']|nr:unnamed protein product [Coregonus sp. 'balchen']